MGFCAVHDYFDVVDSIQLITILVPWVVYFFFPFFWSRTGFVYSHVLILLSQIVLSSDTACEAMRGSIILPLKRYDFWKPETMNFRYISK